MDAIHVRRVGKGLIRDIAVACAKAGVTQREYVLEVLARAVESSLDVKVAHPPMTATEILVSHSEALAQTDGFNGAPRAHDTKTCRVYRCAQCTALGKKY